jgi:hypothetical protein
VNPTNPNAPALAERFQTRLREAIGPDALRQVTELNAAETVKGVCHSHDFCDANEVMLLALDDLGLPSPVGEDEDARDEADALVGEAWAIFQRSIQDARAEV